jgi:hypothetical protein
MLMVEGAEISSRFESAPSSTVADMSRMVHSRSSSYVTVLRISWYAVAFLDEEDSKLVISTVLLLARNISIR